jgi:hypothetical protein
MSLEGVKVGDTIFVYNYVNGKRSGSKGNDATVTKVTKQTVYATIYGWDKVAFKLETGYETQNAYCHNRAWKTRADFEAEKERDEAWRELRNHLHNLWRIPDTVSTERIQEILAGLKGEKK